MHLKPVFEISPRPFHSAKFAAKVEKFNRAVSLHEDNIRKAEQRRAQLRGEKLDVVDLDFDKLDAQSLQNHSLLLLQEELKLRRDFSELEEQAHAELLSEVGAAHTRHEERAAVIRGKLEEIGYLPFDNTQPIPGRWFPGMVNGHPDVLEAMRDHASLQAESMSRDQRRENNERIERVEALLRGQRDRLLGVREDVPAFMKEVPMPQSAAAF